MKTKVFAVFDHAVLAYMTPFNLRSVGEAMRGWIEVVNDPKSAFFRTPEDYTLFCIGEYDDVDGRYTQSAVHKVVSTAIAVKKNRHGGLDEVGDEAPVQPSSESGDSASPL